MSCAKGSILRLTAAIVTAIVITVAASPYLTPEAGANGFTVPIARGNSGPYSYIVGIWPPNPSVGNLHMAITLAGERSAVTDADVTVTGTVGDGVAVAGPLPATSFLEPWNYELDMELTIPGEWTFEIEINSSLGKTLVEALLEVAGDQESAGQAFEEQLATIRAENVSRQAAALQAAGDQEATRQAPTNLSKEGKRSVETLGGGPAVTGDALEDGGFSWAFLALPVAILALASAAWLYRRKRSQEFSRAGRGRQTADSRRRRRP